MGKIGGLGIAAVIALTGCAAPVAATPPPSHAVIQPATLMDETKMGEFVSDIQHSGTIYASMPRPEMERMALDLCEHYDGGFTTEDLRKADGDKLAEAGEAARLTVCPAR